MRPLILFAILWSASGSLAFAAQDTRAPQPPAQRQAQPSFGVATATQQENERTRANLEAALKNDPDSPSLLFQLGVVDLALNRYRDAEAEFRRSYQLNPTSTQALMGLIEVNMQQNKTDEALKLIQAECAKHPDRLDLTVALGNVAVRAGQLDYGIQAFNKAITLTDEPAQRGDLYLRAGETYRRKGDAADAIQALQKARELLPKNLVVLSTLALVLDGAGRKLEAKPVYEAALELGPNNAVVLNNLAFLIAETGGDLDDALRKTRRAKELLPKLPEISDTLGWIYLKKNQTDLALDTFKQLVAEQPSHATFLLHLAMAYEQKGDKAHAREQLQEALRCNPSNADRAEIQRLLDKVGAQ
jgi:tetratricopeptide (TPR) repeat protein